MVDVEDIARMPMVRRVRRRRKVPVAVIGDSMIRQAAGAVVVKEETCKVACLKGKGIQDILAEAKQSVAEIVRHSGHPRRRK